MINELRELHEYSNSYKFLFVLIRSGALLRLKPSRVFDLVNTNCAPRRAGIITLHGFAVNAWACLIR
jgi:hypothetical protein